ncbi:hypothetical protein ACWA16_13485 [Bacillus subtilis]|uniref:hypothetical protein n=1 Tax=Bacillus TaxID=1386 RepID=UPI00155FA842|nr:hypothetical protein [Bacillus subtilis]MEC1490561.1 hypothetical protein [Bacillus subtilis]NRF02342.1 hypothetical protein [Bacillus subtilis]NRG36022.1 hypothetical protein [Bacillus subtilis]
MKFIELDPALQIKVRQLEANAEEHQDKSHPDVRALWLELQKEDSICGALSEKDGSYKVCLRAPVEERNRCSLHGGKTLKGEQMTPAQKLNMMKNLRPRVVEHGWYAEESNFLASLTESEIKYMSFLEKSVKDQYHVNDGLEELLLEDILQSAIIHMRMVNRGVFEKGSRHTARPLQEVLKTIKELGWTCKEKGGKVQFVSVRNDFMASIFGNNTEEEEEDKKLN